MPAIFRNVLKPTFLVLPENINLAPTKETLPLISIYLVLGRPEDGTIGSNDESNPADPQY